MQAYSPEAYPWVTGAAIVPKAMARQSNSIILRIPMTFIVAECFACGNIASGWLVRDCVADEEDCSVLGKKTKQWSKSMESMVLYPNEAQHGGYIDEWEWIDSEVYAQ